MVQYLMKKYKALISDFDNTLVGIDHTLSKPVIEALEKVSNQGVAVTIATGRHFHGALQRNIEKNLHIFKTPVIVHGGAEITDPQTGEVLWGEYISRDVFEKVFAYLTKKEIIFIAEYGDFLYSPDGPKELDYGGIQVFIKPLNHLTSDKIAKILVSGRVNTISVELVDEMHNHLSTSFPELHVSKMGYEGTYGLDITGKTSKHIAVLELMQRMGWEAEEVIGVGDGFNDYPLLTACGTKVAMGDAPEELKEIADFIAPPQKENGIIAVINKYFPL